MQSYSLFSPSDSNASNRYQAVAAWSLLLATLVSGSSALAEALSASKVKTVSAVVDTRVVFSSDFEGAVVKPSPKHGKVLDILEMRDPSGKKAEVGIFYEGGNRSDRFAEVIPDPTKSGNHVLRYWLKQARIPIQPKGQYKGRIQMALADINITEIYQRYRMYLHPDLRLYRSYPKENVWFTINELSFGAQWEGHPYPFRIWLGIGKEKGAGKPLLFVVAGEEGNSDIFTRGEWKTDWYRVGKDFEIPIGEWLDMEVGYKQGNKDTGRFYVAAKRESDAAMTTIFDVRDWTYNPNAKTPVPLTDWTPLKLYTSSAVIDHIRNNGGVAQIYYDDFEILKNFIAPAP